MISSSRSVDEVDGGTGDDGGVDMGAGASSGVDEEAERGFGGCLCFSTFADLQIVLAASNFLLYFGMPSSALWLAWQLI